MISPESYWDALHEMPEGIRDCLKNAQLTEKEYRRLCPAMDRLWNAFGIRCLGRYYSNKDIQEIIFTNCKVEVFKNAVKYVNTDRATASIRDRSERSATRETRRTSDRRCEFKY